MTTRHLFDAGLVTILMMAALIGCATKPKTQAAPAAAAAPGSPAAAPSSEDVARVVVSLATEHVPPGLKAQDKVSVQAVNGKAVTPSGKVAYTTTTLVPEATVVSLKTEPNPAQPEQAVTVELSVTKSQAAMIERMKKQLVRVSESNGNGIISTTSKPVTLRLELNR